MIGSLSAFSPGSIQSYGRSSATGTAQSLASDGSAVCSSLDCGTHGALNRAQLQAQFPGLTLPGGDEAQTAQQTKSESGGETRRPVGGATRSGGLASGATLLGAQQQQAAGSSDTGSAKGADDLSEDERDQVAELKKIDAKVRAHERAHAAVGGAHAGAPSYSYTRGPDGQMYATGGEVSIDISAENDPAATLQKATQVAAAALAPADPSGQDRAVAAAAAQLRIQALAQIREEKRAETEQKEAERAEDKAADAEKQQNAGSGETSAPTTEPGRSAPAGQARQAAAAYQRQAETGPGSQPGANDNPAAEARISATGRQLGRLVGLIA